MSKQTHESANVNSFAVKGSCVSPTKRMQSKQLTSYETACSEYQDILEHATRFLLFGLMPRGWASGQHAARSGRDERGERSR